MKGKNYGWIALADSFANPNIMPGSIDSVYAYHNYKMKLNEFNLEGVLTLNRLRERTGIILYGFGGVGLNYYGVSRDVLDNSAGFFNDDAPYDYSSINLSDGHQQIAKDLRNLSDLEFESEVLSPEFQFMPSLGLGLGYQFTERFSMGIEHKITYALNNDISYIPSNGPNDIYHYTALLFKWNLFNGGGSSSSSTSSNAGNYSSQPTLVNPPSNNGSYSNGPTVINTGNRPIVNIINPSHDNLIVHNSTFHMNAKVYYVSGKNQIKVKHNGFYIQNFSYDVNTKLVQANLLLAPGKNFIEVVATNSVGTDRDEKEIIFEVPQVNEIPPVVVINHPFSSPYQTGANQMVISAKVLNVSSANQISFFVNGLQHTNFLYSPSNDVFTSSILLDEGQNFIDQKINELQQISGVRIELIIIDNLSSLLRTGDENDAESWLPFQNWLLDLRRRNISILFAHHANKEGYQRGTSRRTDIADSVISLRFPQKQSYDLCDFSFEVHFEKTRGAMEQGYESFLAKMTRHDGQNNLPEMFWEYESVVNDSTYKKVIDLMKQGKNQKEVAEILKIHKGTVSKHVNRARSEGKFLS